MAQEVKRNMFLRKITHSNGLLIEKLPSHLWLTIHLQLTLSDAGDGGKKRQSPNDILFVSEKIKGKYFTYFILLFLIMSWESSESLFCPYSIFCGREVSEENTFPSFRKAEFCSKLEIGESEILGYMNKFWGQRCKFEQIH